MFRFSRKNGMLRQKSKSENKSKNWKEKLKEM